MNKQTVAALAVLSWIAILITAAVFNYQITQETELFPYFVLVLGIDLVAVAMSYIAMEPIISQKEMKFQQTGV